jgi:hypothetical protein
MVDDRESATKVLVQGHAFLNLGQRLFIIDLDVGFLDAVAQSPLFSFAFDF